MAGPDITPRRVIAPAGEGVGLGPLPRPRDPAHSDPQWFEMDLDDDYNDPDDPFIDPLPTPRHRELP